MRIKGKMSINANDIIGKCLGKLEVICYAGYRYSLTKGGERMRHYYICKCECGKLIVVQRGTLKNDSIHSCGCVKRKDKLKL